MRYNPNFATQLMRLQEQELRRNAERARTHWVEPTTRPGLVGKIAIAVVALVPIGVFAMSFSGRNLP